MKNRLTAIFGTLLSAIVSMLGFSACSSQADMYGSPYGDFKISGIVTDEADKPVAGARIMVRLHESKGQFYTGPGGSDTITTGANGSYLLSKNGWLTYKVRVVCDDPTGHYLPDSTEVELKYAGGDHDWYEGKAEATVDFKLREAPAGEEAGKQ